MRHFFISGLAALCLAIGPVAAQQPDTASGSEADRAGRPSAEPDTGGAGQSLEDMVRADPARLGGETLFSDSVEHENLGEIQEVVRSADDGELYVVISSEDPLRIDDLTVVPLRDLQLVNNDVIYTGDASELLRKFEEEPYQEARYQPVEDDQLG